MIFESVEMAEPDAILGLTEAFRDDPNPRKINLGVGVYKDEHGKTPVLASVRAAEQRILEREQTKSYVSPLSGTAEYVAAVQQLLFGPDHDIITARRAMTAHTPGGTGALRLAGEYLRTTHPGTTVWLSDPTWANHMGIFDAAAVTTKRYPYFEPATNGLAFDAMMDGLDQVAAGDVVLLHGCCHNPTGVDPSVEQWGRIAELLKRRGIVPLVDFAYQGFAAGIEEDAAGLRTLCQSVPELLICSSFSKNFGLYCERVGALTIVADGPLTAQKVLSRVKICIRRSYSNPPAHGAQIVTTVLGDSRQLAHWQGEVQQMRDRINGTRKLFSESLDARGVRLSAEGNEFIIRQKGMFSFTGLSRQQVETLRHDHSIYIVVSGGRINVAAMTESNMGCLCDAIAKVV